MTIILLKVNRCYGVECMLRSKTRFILKSTESKVLGGTGMGHDMMYHTMVRHGIITQS